MAEAIKVTGRKTGIRDKALAMIPDGNLNACLTCGTCASGCPATGILDMDPRKFLRMAILGMDDQLKRNDWLWVCTMCKRCYDICPMKIDIPQLIYDLRAEWPREERPKGILASCDYHVKSRGGAMGASLDDFKFTVEDLAEECREQPGFEDLRADIDREGAYFALNQNSREPVTEPDELLPLWKIFHIAGADWTYYSEMWGGENYCMFLADDESWEMIIRAQVKKIEELGCKVLINTECGHSFYAIWQGLRRFNIPYNFEFRSVIEYYAKWIREGKLPVNSDWNKDKKIKFTVQDPCNIIRKSMGDDLANDLRFVVKQVVGEENFVDMIPNLSNNFCCGGGGGSLQSGYNDHRREYGKVKLSQIKETGATYVITPCHNCHSQIEDIERHYKAGYHTVHLWTLICLSLGVLGENERIYLGPDLENYGL